MCLRQITPHSRVVAPLLGAFCGVNRDDDPCQVCLKQIVDALARARAAVVLAAKKRLIEAGSDTQQAAMTDEAEKVESFYLDVSAS